MIQAFKTTGLPATERIVAYMLADHLNDSTGRCDPSIALLVDETGLKERAIAGALIRLQKDGHITVNRTTGCRSSYTLHPRTKCGGAPNAVAHDVRGTTAPNAAPPPQDMRDTPAPNADEPERTGTLNQNEPTVPDNSARRTETDALALRLFAILKRPSHLRMSKEERTLFRSAEITEEDVTAVEAYFAAPHPEWKGKDYRFRSLTNLLKKWGDTVGGAGLWTTLRENGHSEPSEFSW